MKSKTNEEILSQCTGLTIDDESAYIIHTKTENVLKAMNLARIEERKELEQEKQTSIPVMNILGRQKGILFYPNGVSFSMLSEEMAQKNHGQSLARLNERCGMSVMEILANIKNDRIVRGVETQKDVDELNDLIKKFNSLSIPTLHPQGSVSENSKVKLEVNENKRRLHIGAVFVDLNEIDYRDLIAIFSLPQGSQISKDKVKSILVREIKLKRVKYISKFVVPEITGIDKAAEEISRLDGEDKWISVEERLPEQEQGFYVCLAFTSTGHQTLKVAFNCLTKKFQTLNFDVIHDIISHWMPLPESPKPLK